MEKIPDNIQNEDSNEKSSRLGGIIKKTLTVAGVAGITLGAMEFNDSVEDEQRYRKENPRNSTEELVGDVLDLSAIKNNKNIDSTFKFYFHSNIHNENGIKWVRILADNNSHFDAVTANPIIINFLEQNPQEENAFLRKNESGQLELVREDGEIVETF
jgi:hypothetical protein